MDGNERKRCPRRPILENIGWWNTLITAYNHYKEGYLPHAGGLNNQHCLYPQLMSLMGSLIAKCEKAKPRKGQATAPTSVSPKPGSQSLLHGR